MGRKGGWFSAIKRVFTPNSKDKLIEGPEKKKSKEKKKGGLGKLKHGDSFIPLFREPSSIEKILGEAEREQITNFRPVTPPSQQYVPSNVAPTWDATLPRPASPPRGSTSWRRASPPRVSTSQREASPLEVSSSQRSSSPPRVASPPPPPPPPAPKRSSSGKGPSKQGNINSVSMGSPPRSAPSPRLDSLQASSAAPTIPPSPPPNVGPSAKPATSSKIASSPKFVHRPRPEPTLRYQNACATKIQAAYRGYMARRNYRALRGLVRLQAVVKGQSVKRQTVNAMKSMQLLVRVQTQIQSRRIQMLENQARQRQATYRNDMESGKWSNGEWDDSTLTKEEVDSRMNRKLEAVMKRERAMAYAYSNQLWKVTPRTAQAALMDLRTSGGYPWWWNWLDRQQQTPSRTPSKPMDSPSVAKSYNFATPPRSVLDSRASPLISQSSNFRVQENMGFDSFDTPTPRSSRSAAPFRTKLAQTPPPPGRTPQRFGGGGGGGRLKAGGGHSPFGGSTFKDDDSLTSCPPFSVPRYMEPTASAKAKVRSEEEQAKRRMSYPMGQGFKWNKRGPLFSVASNASPSPSNKESGSQLPLARKPSMQSIGTMSVDSTVSMPATVGRKPFNRFV